MIGRYFDRGWRIIASGFCFLFFFTGGLLISTLIFPVLHLWPGSQYKKCRRVRYCVHMVFRFFITMMRAFGLISLNTHNIELLQDARSGLVLANHPTLIDVVILVSHMPHVNCVVKGDLFRNRFLGGVLSCAGFINNDNAEVLLHDSKESLANGDVIVIFPEGSRTKCGHPLHFRRGAANIAVRAEVPILSVFITCKPIMLRKGDPWYKIPESRGCFDIWVKEWINPEAMIGSLEDKPASARRLTQALQQYFEEGLKEHE